MKKKKILILGIETSCDDTCIAIYDNKNGLLINKTINQNKIHAKYKGIVPDLASIYHVKNIIPLIKNCLKKTKLNINKINYISYTNGPGLETSLIIGATIAKTISYILKIPSIPINHLEGHIYSVMIKKKKIKYPFLSLIISGGNTLLIKIKEFEKYKILEKTIDDALGETLDKISVYLKLKYPGTKKLIEISKTGISKSYNLPKPMIKKKKKNFSFSGLKTHVINLIKKTNINNKQNKANIARSLIETIIEIIKIKCLNIIKKTKIKRLTISGGLIINKEIRKKIVKEIKKKHINIFFPKKEFCTDNAAMITYVAMKKILNKKIIINNLEIKINPKLTINNKKINKKKKKYIKYC